jgi:hypothetical protein
MIGKVVTQEFCYVLQWSNINILPRFKHFVDFLIAAMCMI